MSMDRASAKMVFRNDLGEVIITSFSEAALHPSEHDRPQQRACVQYRPM